MKNVLGRWPFGKHGFVAYILAQGVDLLYVEERGTDGGLESLWEEPDLGGSYEGEEVYEPRSQYEDFGSLKAAT